MNGIITRDRVHADDPDFREVTFTDTAKTEVVEFVAAHGFTYPERLVFQVEIEVIDCPLLRMWWLSDAELGALTSEQVAAGLTEHVHVSEVAQRAPLPSWWQPTTLTGRTA